MERRNQLGTALVVLAAVLFVVPAFFPVQPVLAHETWGASTGGPEELRSEGYQIVAYEDLSDRGQELYVRTLENGGQYRVSQKNGAPEFYYPTQAERSEAFENDNVSSLQQVVIERPEDDGDLPPADEPRFGPAERDGEGNTSESERRQVASRYELLQTSTTQPPLGATPQLIRLAAALLAVLFLGVGGYLLSSR